MKFPVMKNKKCKHFDIPSISGGVNFGVRPEAISDNQLTECRNMWFKGGVLKTRPPLKISEKMILNLGRPTSDTEYIPRIFKDIRYKANEKDYFLCCVIQKLSFIPADQKINSFKIKFFWQGNDARIELGEITEYEEEITFFVTRHKNNLYCFLSNQKIYVLNALDSTAVWRLVNDNDIYVPTLATNMTYSERQLTTTKQILQRATLVEGLNVLGRRFRVEYSTVNLDYFNEEEGKTEHEMLYYLPYTGSAREYIPEFLEVNITHPNNVTVKHTATVTGSSGTVFYESSRNTIDGLKMEVTCIGDLVYITFLDQNNKIKTVTKDDYLGINMEIIAPYVIPNADNAFSMTRAAWFGGAGEGINQGTRLFIGASVKADEQNLVMWSDAEKPLYFPEYNYFYVGDSSCAVTGFGRQSDMLVIFKERQTYFTQYKQSNNKNSEINDNGADMYERDYSYFPLSIISSNIGCDSIETLELCSNRLVWVNKSGGVYTLVTSDRYSEKNIFEIGGNLKEYFVHYDTEAVSGCDFEGHYVLFISDKIYIMDYNSAGYQEPEDQQINKDANLGIPWYVWTIGEMPIEKIRLATADGAIVLFGIFDSFSGYNVYFPAFFIDCSQTGDDLLLLAENDDLVFSENKINCGFTTKFFDFGKPFNRKNINHVGICINTSSALPIHVSFLGDAGKSGETVSIYKEVSDEHMSSITLSPCIHSVIKVAVGITCDGVMSIGGLGIDYTLLGTVR